MIYAEFHRKDAPLFIVEFTGAKANAQNFAAYLKGLKENYDAKQNIAIVFDARRSLDLNPIYQLKQAVWLQQNKETIERYCKGVAYVVPNIMLRNMLGMVFKIQPNPVPFEVFKSLDAGVDWAKNQLYK
jgi:hypothetical protein